MKTCTAGMARCPRTSSNHYNQFNLGLLDLRQRAVGEELYWRITSEINLLVGEMGHPPRELRRLSSTALRYLHDQFSIFQSIPDAWAVNQLFPIVQIHRLNEPPDREGIWLMDLM